MNLYNINYGKVIVLLFIMITFYWLMIPAAKEENLSPTKDNSKSHPHHDHHELAKEKKGEGKFAEEKIEVEGGGEARLKSHYEPKLAERENTIEILKDKLLSATKNNKETQTQLEEEIKRISKKSDELESKYKKLYEEYSKLKDNTVSNEKLVPFKGMKLIHLDLKGAPPKLDYLLKLMEKMKEYGAGGLLIEYEDMFPWHGELSMLARKNAYSKENVTQILNKASDLKLEVVPLIQTFGHLEFVLKHKEFAGLRAVKKVSTSICPLNEKSVPLIKKLVDQVLEMHPNLKWIHLGGDEVWNIRNCDRCVEGNFTDTDLYHRHMLPIINHVKTSRKSLTPVVWDDMMRTWLVDDLKKMAEHVVPMVWGYVDDLSKHRSFPAGMWDRYMEAFPKLFFASSFKGALKPWSNFVPIRQHLNNHLSWLKIYKEFLDKGKTVEGIALTGWSRFDHYGPLCELLPVGIPSMALCLAILDHGGFDEALHNNTSKLLGFQKPFQTDVTYFKTYSPENGTFPGHKLYTLVGLLEQSLGYKDWAEVRLTGWARPFTVTQGHLSYFQLSNTKSGIKKSLTLLQNVKKAASSILAESFCKDTIEEWINEKIEFWEENMNEKIKKVESILKKDF